MVLFNAIKQRFPNCVYTVAAKTSQVKFPIINTFYSIPQMCSVHFKLGFIYQQGID